MIGSGISCRSVQILLAWNGSQAMRGKAKTAAQDCCAAVHEEKTREKSSYF
jgi:hypothetical protein